MHILVLPTWYPTKERPGRGTFCQAQVRSLEKQGMRVGVVHPEARSLRRLQPSRLVNNHFQSRFYWEEGRLTLRCHGWNVFGRSRLSLRYWIWTARRLVRQYIERAGPPDLIHAHSALNAGVAAASLQNTLGLPYVLTEHYGGYAKDDKLFSWQWAPARNAFVNAQRVLTVSKALRITLDEKKLIPSQEVSVLPNMIDMDFFTLPPYPRNTSSFRLLFVGRLVTDKNVSLLLKAFREAFPDENGPELMLVGDGPERWRLEQCAQRLKIATRVTFCGEQSPQGVRTAMHRANALVLPSAYETFGVVLIEAMATGLPVVTTAHGGPEQIVTPETGRLLHPPSRDALADALRDVHANYDRYHPQHIRSHALPYSLELVGAQLMTHLKTALNQSAVPDSS